MLYDYSYHVSSDSALLAAGMMLLVVAAVALVPSVVLYVLRSLSVYTIAKRRGLNKPWLAWIPVGYEWTLGSVSDQFKYLTEGKIQNRRKILMALSIATLICWMGTLATVGMYGVLVSLRIDVQGQGMLGLVVLAAMLTAVSVTAYVFRCMSLYDLYKSCDPKNAMAYLIVGILFHVTEAIFLMFCRNKDGGMPPRRPEPQPEPQPEPWQAPAEE